MKPSLLLVGRNIIFQGKEWTVISVSEIGVRLEQGNGINRLTLAVPWFIFNNQ